MVRRRIRRALTPALWLGLAACGRESRPDAGAEAGPPPPAGVNPRMIERRSDGVWIASAESLRTIPGYVVDSIFPPAEALARFRSATTGPAPTAFSGGAPSADALLRRYWAALVAADTAAVRPLALSRAEFAWVYFAGSAEEQSGLQPHIAWRMLESTSGVGLQRAQGRASGASATVLRTFCAGAPRTAGEVRSVGPCGVVVAPGGPRDSLPLAARIVIRNGVAKLFGYANGL